MPKPWNNKMETDAGKISRLQQSLRSQYLSRLDMDNNDHDELKWDMSNLPLTYQCEVNKQIQPLFPLAAEKELKPQGPCWPPDLIKYY